MLLGLVWLSGLGAVHAGSDLQLYGRSEAMPEWAQHLGLSVQDEHWLRQKRILKVAVGPGDNAPLQITSVGGHYEGVSADYLRLATQLLGLEVQIVHFDTLPKALQALQAGTVDLLGVMDAQQARTHQLMLSQPYALDQSVMVMRSTAGSSVSPGGVERVAVVADEQGQALAREHFPEAALESFSTATNALAAVAFDQADVYLGSALGAHYLLAGRPLPKLKMTPLAGAPDRPVGWGLAPSQLHLRDLLNAALQAIPVSEQLKILRRWSIHNLEVPRADALTFDARQQQWVQQRKVLRVLINPDFAPMTYLDTDGEFAGASADVLNYIAQRTGLRLQVVQVSSLEQMEGMIERGEADLIAALAPSESRLTNLRFSRSYLASSMVLVTGQALHGAQRLEQMAGRRVAVPYGSVAMATLLASQPTMRQLIAPGGAAALAMVDRGDADAAAVPWMTARYNIASRYSGRLRIALALPMAPVEFAFAVSRHDPVLLSMLNDVLLSIAPQQLNDLTRGARSDLIHADTFWQRYRGIILQSFIIAMLSLLCALGWVSYLRRQIRRRVIAEQALTVQVEFMQVMIDGTPHPIYIRDHNTRLVNCNISYLKALGISREDAIGQPITGSSVLDSTEAQYLQSTYLQVMAQGVAIVEDREVVLRNGTRMTINHWMLPYRGGDGQIQGLIAGWVDITDRQQLCEAYQVAKEEAEAASKAKTTFLATMSHEIRTPMNAVLGMLELALKKADQGKLDKPALEVASQAAEGLLGLIGDILDITRIEAGRLELLPLPTQLGPLINAVARLFEGQARHKHLSLHLEMTGETNAWVMVDPLRIKQILGNILSNAIKFTHEGRVKVGLAVATSATSAKVRLCVEDTGIGIAAADIQRVGGAYRQARGAGAGNRSGAGLGLNICHSLLALMGGQLRLHSVLGSGTRVSLEFEADLGQSPSDDQKVDVPWAVQPALYVLVVDDYPANRVLLERQLSFLGHHVSLAEHGAAGLRAWLRGSFDVVISDCNMPGMNGYQLARAVREDERRKGKAPCLFLGCTANAQKQERQRCLQQGMDDCLFKPLSLQNLAEKLVGYRTRCSVDDHEIDLTNLHQLTAGDQCSLQRLLADLADSTREDLARLQAFGAPYDYKAVADLVHRIKGGARIVRAQRLLVACEALERCCATPGGRSELHQGIEQLADAMTRLGQYLERYGRAG